MTREPTDITSLQNPRVKYVVKLRDSRHRQRAGQYLIDGAREIGRALDSGARMAQFFACRELCASPESRDVLARFAASDIETFHCTRPVFEKLAYGDRAEGVLAVGITPETSLDRLALAEGLIGVLVGVEKPGNVGAVMRSADGAGLAALLVVDAGSDLFNPNCIRASLGTIFNLTVATATSEEALAWLRERQYRIFAARPDAERLYTEVDLTGEAALVLGSEAHGLPVAWQGTEITPVRLPMRGLADSLNVSVTAGILFYEALRQRAARGE